MLLRFSPVRCQIKPNLFLIFKHWGFCFYKWPFMRTSGEWQLAWGLGVCDGAWGWMEVLLNLCTFSILSLESWRSFGAIDRDHPGCTNWADFSKEEENGLKLRNTPVAEPVLAPGPLLWSLEAQLLHCFYPDTLNPIASLLKASSETGQRPCLRKSLPISAGQGYF